MRQLVNYTITGEHTISVPETFTANLIRLIVNETKKEVLCSSMLKDLISVSGLIITVTGTLASTDILTVEIDLDNIAKKSDLNTLLGADLNATLTKLQSDIAEIPTSQISDYAKRSDVKNGGSTTIGMLEDATYGLQKIKQAVDAIPTSPITGYAKEELVKEGNDTAISVGKSIKEKTDKIGSFTDPTETVAHKLENITFDKSDLAKEATLGTPNDTASANTIFGKIANLLSTWNTWISGAWTTMVTNISTLLTRTGYIGTPATGQANTLFGAIEEIEAAHIEEGVTRIQQRLAVADSYEADVIPTATAESKAQDHLRAVHGAVSGEQSTTNYKLYGVVRVKHAATDQDSNFELASLNRNLVYGGATKDKSWQSGGQVVTTKVPDTGYGFTEFWLKNGDSWIHYASSLPSQQDNINTLHPALHTTTTDQQGNIVRTPTHIIVLTNPE